MTEPALQLLLRKRPELAPLYSAPADVAPADARDIATIQPGRVPAEAEPEAEKFPLGYQLLRDPDRPGGPGDRPRRVCYDRVGQQGPTGGTPGPIGEVPPTGSAGLRGSVASAQILPTQFINHFDITFADLLLASGEQAYINRRFVDALNIFLWLRNALADAYNDRSSPFLSRVEKARIYLRQIELALDYYGLPLNYAPLVSYELYKSLIEEVLVHAERVEQAYTQLRAQSDNIAVARESARTTLIALEGVILSARQQISELTAQIGAIEIDIAAMRPGIEQLWNELIAANNSFQRAVARRENRCGFAEILQCVGAIAALVSSGGTLIAAIGAAKVAFDVANPKDANGRPITGDFEVLRYKIGTLSPIISTAIGIADQYGRLKALLNPSGTTVSGLPDDGAKLIVERDKFDAELQKYLDLPEARDYQQLMHRYVDAVLSRNQKILEYNALWNKRDDCYVRIVIAETDRLDVGSRLSRTENPEIEFLANFVERAYRTIKLDVVQLIYNAGKSLNYLAGRVEDIEILQSSVATLSIAATNLLTRFAREKERQARPPQTFGNIVINLKDIVSQKSWEAFLSTGQITFSLRAASSVFAPMSHVHLSKITVRSEYLIRQRKQHSFVFTHHGLSKIINEVGKAIEFSHRPVVAAAIYSAAGEVVSEADFARDTGDFVGVSPFASWTLVIPERQTLDLTRLRELNLVIAGSFWPISAH